MFRRLIPCISAPTYYRSRIHYTMGWGLAWAAWLVAATPAQAEKAAIDANAYAQWPTVGSSDSSISNDGRYASFVIENEPTGNLTLVVRATRGSWHVEAIGASLVGFSDDSRKAVVLRADHSLDILTLGSSHTDTRLHVESARLADEGSHRWLAYHGLSPDRALHVLDLTTGAECTIPAVDDFQFASDGKSLLVQTQSNSGNPAHILTWINLANGASTPFWRGGAPRNIVLDKSIDQLAFLAVDTDASATGESVWYYKAGAERAQKVFDPQLQPLSGNLALGNVEQFLAAGTYLLVHLAPPAPLDAPAPGVNLDVWSYKDTKLQSQQLKELEEHQPRRPYAAVIRLSDHRLTQLEHENDDAEFSDGDTVLIHHQKGDADGGESAWNPATRGSVSILSIATSEKSQVLASGRHGGSLSPGGRFVIDYSPEERSYFSYEVASGKRRNITAAIGADWTIYGNDHSDASIALEGPQAWLQGDAGVVFYDQHDIWVADPTGSTPPVNLTNGYGAKHHIQFRLIEDGSHVVIGADERVMLTAFNRDSKDNGFFTKVLGESRDPTRLTMGPYVYKLQDVGGFAPIKATQAQAYVVSRESVNESRNLFFTTDFKTWLPLSNAHPETQYNWMTSELMEWKLPDGSTDQGVLYKPQNFDPSKKYPVIFYYYQKLSQELNEFKVPGPVFGQLNIPTFVSRGYLVFTPDIHYEIGHQMRRALNTVVSAAEYLSTKPWVDATKLGLQGHSFGGTETNYIVAHSHLFAAANAASGIGDFVSGYDSIGGGGASLQSMYESGRWRVGATLWQRPDLYIENSAIFQADQVTTPLLLFHTDKDGVCLFPQAVEFFTALRRLGKKVWMLEYEGYDHVLPPKSTAAADFTTRLMQFFDFYLKAAPPPKWMTEGVPAQLKGIDTGLELDARGREP